jgi:6-phosphogluconate dehydrogenase
MAGLGRMGGGIAARLIDGGNSNYQDTQRRAATITTSLPPT